MKSEFGVLASHRQIAEWRMIQILFLVLPIYLGDFAQVEPLTQSNFSSIGNRQEYRTSFILWAILNSGFLTIYTQHLLEQVSRRSLLARTLLDMSCIALLITVLLPFLPDNFPMLSRLHSVFAKITPVFLWSGMFVLVWQLTKWVSMDLQKFLAYLVIIGIAAVFLICEFGIGTSLVEVFACMALEILLYSLHNEMIKMRLGL